MINCTDCNGELEQDEVISVAYQVSTDTGIMLMEVELPLCLSCAMRREKTAKRRKKSGKMR